MTQLKGQNWVCFVFKRWPREYLWRAGKGQKNPKKKHKQEKQVQNACVMHVNAKEKKDKSEVWTAAIMQRGAEKIKEVSSSCIQFGQWWSPISQSAMIEGCCGRSAAKGQCTHQLPTGFQFDRVHLKIKCLPVGPDVPSCSAPCLSLCLKIPPEEIAWCYSVNNFESFDMTDSGYFY